MNAPIPTGTETLIKSILKFMGIKPEQILGPLEQIRVITIDAGQRLERIEEKQKAIDAKLDFILERTNND